MVKLNQIREGSIIKVRGGFGTEPAKRAVVTGVEENIKNGRPGIDYRCNGDERWAYLDQVVEVETY